MPRWVQIHRAKHTDTHTDKNRYRHACTRNNRSECVWLDFNKILTDVQLRHWCYGIAIQYVSSYSTTSVHQCICREFLWTQNYNELSINISLSSNGISHSLRCHPPRMTFTLVLSANALPFERFLRILKIVPISSHYVRLLYSKSVLENFPRTHVSPIEGNRSSKHVEATCPRQISTPSKRNWSIRFSN